VPKYVIVRAVHTPTHLIRYPAVEFPTSPQTSPSSLGKRKTTDRSDSQEQIQSTELRGSGSRRARKRSRQGDNKPHPHPPMPFNSQEVIVGCQKLVVHAFSDIWHGIQGDPAHWQPYFENSLCYGVQYEIARLVSLGCIKYDQLTTAYLDRLRGSNADAAPKTVGVLAELLSSNPEDVKVKVRLIVSVSMPRLKG
jgi:hypothetical protein